jgi:uridine kinase
MIVIGIAGGSGSGKSTFADLVRADLEDASLAVIRHDSYYKPLDHLPLEERRRVNFDHPDALENSLMIEDIRRLKSNDPIQVPEYDFSRHTRKDSYLEIKPPTVLIVEGILIFYEAEMRELFDMKIFIDTDDDDRLMRRMRRDINERGRSLDEVINRYKQMVKPAHLEFVEPSKRWADIIIPHGGKNKVGLDLINTKLKMLLRGEPDLLPQRPETPGL